MGRGPQIRSSKCPTGARRSCRPRISARRPEIWVDSGRQRVGEWLPGNPSRRGEAIAGELRCPSSRRLGEFRAQNRMLVSSRPRNAPSDAAIARRATPWLSNHLHAPSRRVLALPVFRRHWMFHGWVDASEKVAIRFPPVTYPASSAPSWAPPPPKPSVGDSPPPSRARLTPALASDQGCPSLAQGA